MRVLLPKRGSLNCGRNWRSSTLFQFGDASVSTAASLTGPSARARTDVGVVADQEHDRAVGTAANRVRAVIAHARRRVAVDPLDPIHHVVAVGVLQLVEAGHATRRGLILSTAPAALLRRRAGCAGCAGAWRAWRRGAAAALLSAAELRLGGRRRIAGHLAAAIAVERRPVGVEEAMTRIQHLGDDLLALVDAVLVLVEQHARRAAGAGTALRDDRAALRIERDDDVGLGLVGRRHTLDLESGEQRERGARRKGLLLRAFARRRRLLLPRLGQAREQRERRDANTEIFQWQVHVASG